MLSDQGGAQEHGRSPRRAGQVPGVDAQRGGDPAGVRRRLQGGDHDLLRFKDRIVFFISERSADLQGGSSGRAPGLG